MLARVSPKALQVGVHHTCWCVVAAAAAGEGSVSSPACAHVPVLRLQKAPGQESPEQAAERLALLLRMVKYPLPQPNDP